MKATGRCNEALAHQIAVSQAKDGGVDEVRAFQATETPCSEA